MSGDDQCERRESRLCRSDVLSAESPKFASVLLAVFRKQVGCREANLFDSASERCSVSVSRFCVIEIVIEIEKVELTSFAGRVVSGRRGEKTTS